MSIEGLWSIQFQESTKGNTGAGVVVFETQRVFGGDSGYYYIGNYKVEGNKMEIEAKITKYGHVPMDSIFGPLGEFDVIMKGDITEKELLFQGHLKNNPSLSLQIIGKKLSDLP